MTSEPVIIVTGASGNVGAAICRELAAAGSRVIAVDRVKEPLQSLIASLPSPERHVAVADADLTQRDSCDKLVAATLARCGRIDGVAATVGSFLVSGASEVTIAQFRQMFDINVITALNIFQAVLPAMRTARSGSLVAISAGAALRAPTGFAAYSASKSALLRLVEAFADELRHDSIRVNAVMPGTIDTPLNRTSMPDADHDAWVKPVEIARAIAFLLSPASSGITGAAIPLPGRG